jgi:hypothetical protein
MDAAELDLQVAATRAFILADAEDITLYRSVRQSDGAGGYKYGTHVPLAPQVARLIPQTDAVPEFAGQDGRRATPEWVILLEPESDMQRYDRFEWRGDTWEIVQVHSKPDYEMKGDVIRIG